MFRAPVRIGVIFFLSLTFATPSEAQGDRQPKFQEYFHPLRGEPRDLELNKPAAEPFVKWEPAGLLLMFPGGVGKSQGIFGVKHPMTLRGDFEITAAFEVLREPKAEDTGPQGTKVHLMLTVDRPPWDVTGITRHLQRKWTTRYTAWSNHWNPETRKNDQEIRAIDARDTRWRFRLKRTAADLSYEVAEQADADFRRIAAFTFLKEDVKDVRVAAETSGANAALDVRVTDLRIRAEALIGVVADEIPVAKAADGAAPPAPPRSHLWLVASLGVVLLALLIGSLLLRRRSAAAAR